jgi:hypothetical protein
MGIRRALIPRDVEVATSTGLVSLTTVEVENDLVDGGVRVRECRQLERGVGLKVYSSENSVAA